MEVLERIINELVLIRKILQETAEQLEDYLIKVDK